MIHLIHQKNHFIFFGNYNGDGKTDFIKAPDKTSYSSSDNLELYLNDDGTSFTYTANEPLPDNTINYDTEVNLYTYGLPDFYATKTYGLTVNDYDGDGKDDLIIGTREICLEECIEVQGNPEYIFFYFDN